MTARVIRGFPAQAWHSYPSTSPYHDVDWLSVMISRLPGEVHTVLDDERGMAFVGAVISDPDGYEAYNPDAILWRDPPVYELDDPAGRAEQLTLHRNHPPTLPALVLVAPGYDGDPAGVGGADREAIAACLAEVFAWCTGAGLAGLHVLCTSRLAVAEAIAALGGVGYPMTTRSVLPVWWDDWRGYLDGLNNKKRRKAVRRELRCASDEMELVEVAPLDFVNDLIDGRCALLRRHGQHADAAKERSRLELLGERFGSRLVAYGGLRDGRLVASCLCLKQGRTVQIIYSAVTARAEEMPFAHFATTYYAVVKHVARSSCDAVDYGISDEASKRLRGCVARQLRGHALAVSGAARESLAVAAGLLTRYGRLEAR